MKILIVLSFLATGIFVRAQVAINSNAAAPDNSSMLDVKSTTRGLLIPRMTAAQRDAIASPATGLLILCTDNNLFYSNQGTAAVPSWIMVNSQWLSGASGINYNGGNVGIGTNSPQFLLDVQGMFAYAQIKALYPATGSAALFLDKYASTDNNYVVHRQGGAALWTEGTIGNNNFSLRNWSLVSDALTVNLANNDIQISGRVGIKSAAYCDLYLASSDYTATYFSTPYSGATAFEFFANGPGNTWSIYSNAPTSGYAGYFAGNVFCSGSYLPSDEKLKENIEPLQNGLDKVMKLDIRTYNFKTAEFPELNLPTDRQNGFIAQNIESVFPELVRVNPAKKEQPTAFKAVNYVGMIPVLAEAMQEQQKQLEARDARIDSLQKQLDDLKILVLNIQKTQKPVPGKD